MYVTLLQLAESPGAVELAQVASASFAPIVDAQLMDITLRGGDRSAYSAGDIAAADDAAARIGSQIDQAGSVIDGFLARRYQLPLSPVPTLLAAWATAIVRYKLAKDRVTDPRTDPIARDYQEAMRLLASVAAGQFSLGVDDPTLQPPAFGESSINPGSKLFGRDSCDTSDPFCDAYGAGRGF
ncbi:MAG: DUF1320 domain-containing protein [Proteobacteria bacterium]|nr:DUF1320 domain-containing protein [Pseudomonadota bacterium]